MCVCVFAQRREHRNDALPCPSIPHLPKQKEEQRIKNRTIGEMRGEGNKSDRERKFRSRCVPAVRLPGRGKF